MRNCGRSTRRGRSGRTRDRRPASDQWRRVADPRRARFRQDARGGGMGQRATRARTATRGSRWSGRPMDDVRRVMVEGDERADGGRARRRAMRCGDASAGEVHFRVGRDGASSIRRGAPEQLRGPEHHAAWCDELAKWRHGDAAWDNLMHGAAAGRAAADRGDDDAAPDAADAAGDGGAAGWSRRAGGRATIRICRRASSRR